MIPKYADATNLRKLQRELADKITAQASLDEIRITLASGAKVNEPVVQGLRPLHYAAYSNYFQAVQLLIVRGSDVNACDEVGYSPLHLTAEHGNFKLLEYLIKQNAQVSFVHDKTNNAFADGLRTEEPLRLAIKNGHYECAELLLQSGADPNAHYFLGSEISLIPPTAPNFLRLALMYGANPNVYDRDGHTPLMKAARHKCGMQAVKILVEYGANINAVALKKQDFRTPLHYAILSGNADIVEYLVKRGANVNMYKGYEKPGPLDVAVLRDDLSILDMLLKSGADPNAAYTYIVGPEKESDIHSTPDPGRSLGTPMHLACCSDLTHQYEIMERLLQFGAKPNYCPVLEDGILRSPMNEYFRSGRSNFEAKFVRLLLAYGGEVIMRSPLNHTRGMLRALTRLNDSDAEEDVWELLLDAGESYSTQGVERLSLSASRRLQLIEKAHKPASLSHISRLTIRKSINTMKPESVLTLPIPPVLKDYIVYEYFSLDKGQVGGLDFSNY